jgi:hypothetical protein
MTIVDSLYELYIEHCPLSEVYLIYTTLRNLYPSSGLDFLLTGRAEQDPSTLTPDDRNGPGVDLKYFSENGEST